MNIWMSFLACVISEYLMGPYTMYVADGQHFIAIRYVSAYGIPVPADVTSQIPRTMALSRMMLMSTYCPAIGLGKVYRQGHRTVLQNLRDVCTGKKRAMKAHKEVGYQCD